MLLHCCGVGRGVHGCVICTCHGCTTEVPCEDSRLLLDFCFYLQPLPVVMNGRVVQLCEHVLEHRFLTRYACASLARTSIIALHGWIRFACSVCTIRVPIWRSML
jgi:hypothetical protein